MDFRSAVKVSAKAVRKECRRRHWWNHLNDICQEVTVRIWLTLKSGEPLTKNIIYCMVKGLVVAAMREDLGRAKTKSVYLSDRQWEELEQIPIQESCGTSDILDTIEDQLENDERILFRHMRLGHNTDMVAKATGFPVEVIRRDMNRLLAKAKEIWRTNA